MLKALTARAGLPLLLMIFIATGCQSKYAPTDPSNSPQKIAEYLEGGWTATVERHADEQSVRGANGAMNLSVGKVQGNSAAISGLASRVRFDGTVTMLSGDEAKAAAADMNTQMREAGGLWPDETFDDSVSPASGPVHARLAFTTGDFELRTPEGSRTVKGPLNWTGVLRAGRLYGKVSNPAGLSTRWYATKNDVRSAVRLRS